MDEVAVIKTQSVTFHYMDMYNGFHPEIVRGTKLAFAIEVAKDHEVSLSVRFLRLAEGGELKLLDSKGNDLGAETATGREDMIHTAEEKYRDFVYYVTFTHFPPVGSEQLDVAGKIPVQIFSSKTISPPQSLQIKQGTKLFLDDLTMTVEVPKENEESDDFTVEFQFSSPNRDMKIIGMDFYDKDGHSLIDDKGNLAYSSRSVGRMLSSGGTFEIQKSSFKQPPGLLRVVVNYWTKVEELDLPFSQKILLYDQDETESNQQKK